MIKRKKRSKGDIVIDIIVYGVLVVLTIICVYPLLYCVSGSISGKEAIASRNITLIPKSISFESFKMLWDTGRFPTAFAMAIYYTMIGTIFQLTGTLLYGYVFSRKDFVFKKFLATYTLIPMVFSGGLIPTFMVIKELGLYGSYWALWLPSVVSLWNALIAKTFFQSTISDSLYDAARIDGCSQFQVFIKIVLPLSKSIIAILALYAGVGYWNDYFGPMIYINDKARQPLQVLLADLLAVSGGGTTMSILVDGALMENVINSQRMKYVVIVVATLPIMLIYPFLQKFFVKGVMIGSVKG